jgi:hypothetical protein
MRQEQGRGMAANDGADSCDDQDEAISGKDCDGDGIMTGPMNPNWRELIQEEKPKVSTCYQLLHISFSVIHLQLLRRAYSAYYVPSVYLEPISAMEKAAKPTPKFAASAQLNKQT